MVVEKGQVVWSDIKIGIGKSDEARSVDDGLVFLVGVAEDRSSRLESVSSIVTGDIQRGVRNVELVDESSESRLSSIDQSPNGRVVAVIIRDGLSRSIPGELDPSSSFSEGSSVVGDRGVVAILKEIRFVGYG